MTLKKGSDFSLIIENVNGSDTPVTFNIVNGLERLKNIPMPQKPLDTFNLMRQIK